MARYCMWMAVSSPTSAVSRKWIQIAELRIVVCFWHCRKHQSRIVFPIMQGRGLLLPFVVRSFCYKRNWGAALRSSSPQGILFFDPPSDTGVTTSVLSFRWGNKNAERCAKKVQYCRVAGGFLCQPVDIVVRIFNEKYFPSVFHATCSKVFVFRAITFWRWVQEDVFCWNGCSCKCILCMTKKGRPLAVLTI